MTALSAKESMNTIDKFIREVGAAEKSAAEADSEPGSVGGATEHPVKDVDDYTEVAEEGARSQENDEDVKKEEGPASVDSQPVASPEKSAEGKSEGGAMGDPVQSPGSAADDQVQVGTVKEPTGDDPPVETAGVKAEKEDVQSQHPARTDNSELDGLKYAEAELQAMPLEDLAKVASDLSNQILAELAVHDFRNKEGMSHYSGESKSDDSSHDDSDSHDDDDDSDEKKAKLKGDQHKLDADGDGKIEGSDLAALRKDDDKKASAQAAAAGSELAGLLTGDLDKAAVDSMVQGTLEDVIKVASDDADRVAVFLANYGDELSKQAAAQEEALSKKAEGGMPMAPEAAMVAEEEVPSEGEAELVEDMLGGAAEAPVGEAPVEGAGEVEELAAILDELGIAPEELEAAMAAEGAGAPMMPGMDDMAAEAMAEVPAPEEEAAGLEVEASAKEAAAKKGNAMAGVRDYIQELIKRSKSA